MPLRSVQNDHSFEMEIRQCIEHALSNFGQNVPSMVLGNLSWIGGISKDEITTRPDKFERSLDIIFREASSSVKRAIFEEIMATFGLADCSPNFREVFAKASQLY